MTLPRALIAAGLLLALIGVLWELKDRLGWLSWLGHLPGDINYTSANTRVFIPLTTCLLLSAVVSGITALIRFLSKP